MSEPELNVEAKPKGHGRCPQCNHTRAGHTEKGCLLCGCSTAFGRDELGRSVKITTHDIADGLDNGQITVGTAEAMILALIQQVSDQRVREVLSDLHEDGNAFTCLTCNGTGKVSAPAPQPEALTPLSDKALDTLISDLGHDLSAQPKAQEVETRFLAELMTLGRKYYIRSLRNDLDKTNDSNVEEFKQGIIAAFREAIATITQAAYERGRIAEAKTCEQAQRHDVKAAVKRARIEEVKKTICHNHGGWDNCPQLKARLAELTEPGEWENA